MDNLTPGPAGYKHLKPTVTVFARDCVDGEIIPMHSHERAQLLYAVSGIMQITTKDMAWLVPPQRAIWIAPDMPHTTLCRGHVAMRTAYVLPDANPFQPSECLTLTMTPLVRELILRLLQEPMEYDLSGGALLTAQLLLHELPKLNRPHLNIPLPGNPRLQHVCDYILKHPDHSGDMAFYADMAATSPRNLQRLFHQDFNITFGDWRKQVTLLYALTALQDGARISSVAHQLNYRSVSAFTAMFRQHFGAPPTEFLKRF